jgi:hypothetical protein
VKNRQKVTLKEKGEHFDAKPFYLKNAPKDLEAKLDFPVQTYDICGY